MCHKYVRGPHALRASPRPASFFQGRLRTPTSPTFIWLPHGGTSSAAHNGARTPLDVTAEE